MTRTLVDADDPGFTKPTKPIGRFLPADEAAAAGRARRDLGGPRREGLAAASSPRPSRARSSTRRAVRALVDAGFVVVANGGGGIPVVREADGRLRGVEAVIDKDLGAALLARTVDADVLVIATDVPHAVLRYGTPEAEDLGAGSPSRAARVRRRGPLRQRLDGPQGRRGLPVRRAGRPIARPSSPTSTHLDRTRSSRRRRGTVVVPDLSRLGEGSTRHALRHRSPQGPDPLRRRRVSELAKLIDDGVMAGRPRDRDHRQDRGQRRRQRLHPDHRRPRVPRGAGRRRAPRPTRSSRSRSCGPAAPTA